MKTVKTRKGRNSGLVLALAALVCCSLAAQAQTWTVIHSFSGPDGSYPGAGLTMDAAGNLYGTASGGGTHGHGTVFKLTHKPAGWIFTPLYSFAGPDGNGPSARVMIGPDGTLYGTTVYGGAAGYGTVFRLQPPAGFCRSFQCPWTETVLYSFRNGSDGGEPGWGDLAFDQQGNIYGTTSQGGYNGSSCYGYGCGVLYKLTRSGGSWAYSVLYSFQGGNDGFRPIAGVIPDASGNLYGTTEAGGPNESGTVYKLTSSGSGWTESILYDFPNFNDGGLPYGGLIFDRFGNLYGTTSIYGLMDGGTVYELTPANGGWNFSVLTAVSAYAGPTASPSMDASGNLYGTISFGSFEVFKVTHSGNDWIQTQFQGGSDGTVANVIVDSSNTVYGTDAGGIHSMGSVFAITQ